MDVTTVRTIQLQVNPIHLGHQGSSSQCRIDKVQASEDFSPLAVRGHTRDEIETRLRLKKRK